MYMLHARYLHLLFLGMRPGYMLHKIITLIVVATGLAQQFSCILQLPYSSGVSLLNQFQAASKISAVGVGNSYHELCTTSYQS